MKSQAWKIGNVTIPNRVVVAPMAGVTNVAFRTICKKFGAGLVTCEMISDRGLIHHNQKTLGMLSVNPNEYPMSIQLFGNSKETLVPAAQYLAAHTPVDIININMGCPVRKVVKTGAGSHWLLYPDKIYDLVSALVKNVDKPITVKMRTGWDEDHIYAIQNALSAQDAGASAIAMHGRTRKQFYRGHANWDILRDVASHLSIPFIGNGDVRTPQDAKRMLDYTGCTAVMIARGVLGNPWMLKRTVHYLATGELLPEPTVAQKIAIAKDHLHRLVGLRGAKMGPRIFRGQAAYYLKGMPHAARTKVAIFGADTEDQMDKILDRFVEKAQRRQAILKARGQRGY